MEAILIVSLLLRTLTPIAVVLGVLFVLVRTAFGRTLVERLLGARRTEEDWLALESEVMRLGEELADVHERIDFAERTRMLEPGLDSGYQPPSRLTPSTPVTPTTPV